MKPIIKKKLAIFNPQGFLDGGNARSVILPQDVTTVVYAKCEVVLVSLKKIVFFNKRGLSTVLEALQQVENKSGAMVGFCDYDNKKFNMIMDMYNKVVPFSMFDTEEIGSLFAGGASKNSSVLVYNDDKEQKNQLSMELYELGYEPKVAKDMDEYTKLSSEGSFKYIIRNSRLGSFDRAIQVFIKNNSVIYMLKEFLDSSLADNFDMLHHENALKLGFSYYLFEASKVSSVNVHAVNFIAKLSTAGAEHGATISVCGLTEHSITQALKNDLEDAGVLLYKDIHEYFSDKELFGEDGGGALNVKKPRSITKKLVEILPMIMEVSNKMIESMSHGKLEKTNIKVQDLTLKDEQVYSVAIAFYGQVEGMMALSFSKDVAIRACKVLLHGEYGDTEILDALGELINIIGGKLISKLRAKNIKANITMPRTYASSAELMAHKKGTKGAQVDFNMDSSPMTLFLTK